MRLNKKIKVHTAVGQGHDLNGEEDKKLTKWKVRAADWAKDDPHKMAYLTSLHDTFTVAQLEERSKELAIYLKFCDELHEIKKNKADFESIINLL